MLARIDDAVKASGLLSPDGQLLPFGAPRQWFALTVRANREIDTADWLKRANLAAYWPNYTRNEAASRGVAGARLVRRPRRCALIPGYIFLGARQECAAPFYVAVEAPGVFGWLRNSDGEPKSISEGEIGRIREMEAEANLPPRQTFHSFRIGTQVRFVEASYEGWNGGTVMALADDGRISVGVRGLLGRVTPVWLYPHQIEPLQAAQARPKKRHR